MAKSSQRTRKKHIKVPITLFIIAIIALAIPITVIFSQQQTNFLQFAAKKNNGNNHKKGNNNNHKGGNNKKNNKKKNNNQNNNSKNDESGIDSNRWILGDRTIIVQDYTDPSLWNGLIAPKVSAWSALLQDGAKLAYVRMPVRDCNTFSRDWYKQASSKDVIMICSTKTTLANDILGLAWTAVYPGTGQIWGAFIELNDNHVRTREKRMVTVCHELGHTVGIPHNSSSKSCVKTYPTLEHPGIWDRNTLIKSYGGGLFIENTGELVVESFRN